ncbi:MAG: 4-hydroxy-3-methylbut-2-enyl diphosphate reductase, partial [Proteobacteria bacterium]|nr:4-hydroxy-3-methylbut-2-enyl diphosphate reductase [Pseudomonadota bacterium]
QLVQNADEIDWRALQGIRALGLTAGASAPESLIEGVIAAASARYTVQCEVVETAVEDVAFKVPKVLREEQQI